MDPPSPDPLDCPYSSSPLPNDPSELGELPDSLPSSIHLPTSLRTFPRLLTVSPEPSNDPLTAGLPLFTRFAASHCLSRIPNRKRSLSSSGLPPLSKEPRPSIETEP